eukprot:UN05506
MIIQFYFISILGLITSIAIISLILSVVNILLSILTTLVRRSSLGYQKEFPFTIKLSILQNADGDSGNKNPYRNAGKIKALSFALKALSSPENQFDVEIMSFSQIEKSFFGVVMYTNASIGDIEKFLDNKIEEAIRNTFGGFDECEFSAQCYYQLKSLETDSKTGQTKTKSDLDFVEIEMNAVKSLSSTCDTEGDEGALLHDTAGTKLKQRPDIL